MCVCRRCSTRVWAGPLGNRNRDRGSYTNDQYGGGGYSRPYSSSSSSGFSTLIMVCVLGFIAWQIFKPQQAQPVYGYVSLRSLLQRWSCDSPSANDGPLVCAPFAPACTSLRNTNTGYGGGGGGGVGGGGGGGGTPYNNYGGNTGYGGGPACGPAPGYVGPAPGGGPGFFSVRRQLWGGAWR